MRPSRLPAFLLASLSIGGALSAPAQAAVFISEYVEGSGNNKALEFYNAGAETVDLAADGYLVQMYFNGNRTAGLNIALAGFIEPGGTFVLAQSNAAAEILNRADQLNGAGWFNGDDAVVLRRGGSSGPLLDVIGQIGVDPGTEWGSGLTSTADNTLRRKPGILVGDADGSDAFDPALEWDGFPINTFDGLGAHLSVAPPAEEPPPASGCGAPFTPIYAIQGSGASAALTGPVTTEGVVVGDFEGPAPALRGFYLQDPVGDGDPSTSDGIFVFNGNLDSVRLGQRLRVSGSAGEFQDQTQISQISDLQICAENQVVTPTEVLLPLADPEALEAYEGMLVRLPQTLVVTEHFQLGRFGQVLMSLDERLYQPTHQVAPGAEAQALQAENQLRRLLVDDPLNAQNPDPILFGRGGLPLSAANTLRGGDRISGLVGVLTYTWAGNSASGNAFRLRPVNALGGGVPVFEAANPRPVAPPTIDGRLRVASFNVLNYFNSFSGCRFGVDGAPAACRGADNALEFERQAAKIVEAIIGLDADIIGLMEIENDGYGADSALQDLVDRLNAATAPGRYAFIDVDSATGEQNALGTDAIKVALLYRPQAVVAEGTAALNTGAFGLYQLSNGSPIGRNRPVLAQSFREVERGGRLTVAVNHLKSKGSSCVNNLAPVASDPDLGDGQGNCNLTRTVAAQEMAEWLAGDPTGAGHRQQLILGDLNAYAQEDPIRVLEDAGYTNLIADRLGDRAYGYVFDGQWGYLDHALASGSLLPQVSGVAKWSINADEPLVLDYNTNFKSAGQIASLYAPDAFRSSDHDPVLVGLELDHAPPRLQLRASPDRLFPPNGRQVEVEVSVEVEDDVDPSPQVRLESVRSNEPEQRRGSAPQEADIVVLDERRFLLRAARAGSGEGRLYTLRYRATDVAGNTAFAEVEVLVPHDRRR